MAKRIRKAPTDDAAAKARRDALSLLGIGFHQEVRFRRQASGRWHMGRALRREDDGSLGLSDDRGRQRSIPISDVEVRTTGPRGGTVWVPLVEVTDADEQLGLF